MISTNTIIFKALLQQGMIHPTEQFVRTYIQEGKQKTCVLFRSAGGDLPALDINISFQEKRRPGRGGDINDFILGVNEFLLLKMILSNVSL